MTTVEINDKIKYMKSLVDGYAIVRWKSESKQDMHNRNLWLGAEEEIQERLNLLKVLNENNINRIHQETFLFLENFVKFLDEESCLELEIVS